ncbi:hypothetical protein D915_006291 [Fasciola hepatica]|uniref:Uncharacterized protein n=1 Tax=Fasciola hepatica TaxID=6192 RepID=A0A4E0RAA8_FASHE|nr:hypothetical protein D915_006291 [Fasciola hepatica]
MHNLIYGYLFLILLTGLVCSAPSKSTTKITGSTILKDNDHSDEKSSNDKGHHVAEKLSPMGDSVKKHTQQNSGLLLGKQVQRFQQNLGQDKGGRLPIHYFDHLGGQMNEGRMPRTMLMRTSIESDVGYESDLSGSEKLPTRKLEPQLVPKMQHPGGKFNPSETGYPAQMDKLTSFKNKYQNQPQYRELQPEVTPREHLSSLSLRRGKHAQGNHDDNYRMYQLSHGNARTFSKHPSDMKGQRVHGGRWSDMEYNMNRFTGKSDGSGRWSLSEPHLHHARQDAPEYGLSARRMYNDAYDHRKPEWVGQSRPELFRDQYTENRSSMKYGDRFMSGMGMNPSFSERDWSRRRPDRPSFGGFGNQFY